MAPPGLQLNPFLGPEGGRALAQTSRLRGLRLFIGHRRNTADFGTREVCATPAPQAIQNAISDFQQAPPADPDYAPAYAGLADAFGLLGSVPNDALPPCAACPRRSARL